MGLIQSWLKKKLAASADFLAELVGAVAGYAFGGGAALAVALGKFILGGFLAVICLGILLRFKRGRVANSEIENP